MKMKHVALALAGALTVTLLPAASALAAPSGERALNVTAVVLDQRCLGGDFVRVTLSGQGSSTSTPMFAWDFTNNGSIDTGALARPRVQMTYLDETNVTAELFARNTEGDQDSDTVTFSTLNCP